MTHRDPRPARRARRTRARAALAGAGAALLALAVAVPAGAAGPRPPAPAALSGSAASGLSARLDARLGEKAAGAYYEPGTRRLVVNVLTGTAAATVRAAGAEPRTVRYSTADLDAVADRLPAVPGTAWFTDPRRNRLVVTADRTVGGGELARLRAVVDAAGGAAVLRRTDGELTPYLLGGEAIESSRYRCSLGFNVTRNGARHFLTAGHCGGSGTTWWSAGAYRQVVGVGVLSRFPGVDYGLVRYATGAGGAGAVRLGGGATQRITRAATAVVGRQVWRSGATTGVHSGTVTGVNATVNYPQGPVRGMIRTNVCAEPGDSGGPLFAATDALGLTSGGTGDCTHGGDDLLPAGDHRPPGHRRGHRLSPRRTPVAPRRTASRGGWRGLSGYPPAAAAAPGHRPPR
ncbi:S1 family peptidase [Streptomyces zingiberis]|uniref:S1 family peptidase n=1 Tax=Streptomyces zingiberis TaxID=2053010 RepID=UPI002893792B|nr:S1 family peptidase [Streptomyces zingiberis]